MSPTTKAAILVAAGGVAGAAGFLLRAPSAPSAPTSIPAFPIGWAKCMAMGTKADLAGADRVTWTWLVRDVNEEEAATNVLLPDDDNAPQWMLFNRPVVITYWIGDASTSITWGGPGDFDGDGDVGTDADIEAFFACLRGECCPACTADLTGDGDVGTDADIEALYAALAGR